MPRESRYGYEKWGPILENTEFWDNLESLKPYFDRLKDLISTAESSRTILASAFHKFLKLGFFIFKENTLCEFNDMIKQCYLKIFYGLDYWLLLACYACCPTYRCQYLTENAIKIAGGYSLFVLRRSGLLASSTSIMKGEYEQYIKSTTRQSVPSIDDSVSWWKG